LRDTAKERYTLEEIFLCHASDDAREIQMLAEELRLRGMAPWVDKDGGFQIGDASAGEAERVIGEDCFGLLFYATPEAFSSDFIRLVEVRRAVRRKEEEDPSFVLFAVPRRIGFKELSERSIEAFGTDLAGYSSRALEHVDQENGESLRTRLGTLADEVLDKVVGRARENGVSSTLQMQFSTRERLADEPSDVLRVDAVAMLERSPDPAARQKAWERVHEGLLHVKRRASRHLGRPRLRVHGSKHLTAAFTLGYVFPSTVCALEIRTRGGYWVTDGESTPGYLLEDSIHDGTVGSESLYVEVSTGAKSVRDSVRRHVARTRVSPLKYLRFTPGPALASAPYMSDADARSIVLQVRRKLSRTISNYGISDVHVFATVPQALAMMIGHNLNAMPPVQLYEYDGSEYSPSHKLSHQTKASPMSP
jgi:hypothetical protein